jgi:hypothetical protein
MHFDGEECFRISGNCGNCSINDAAWNKLAAYEDLGSVEEIEEVKESAKFYKIAGEELCKLEIKIADGRLVEVVRCRDCKYRNTSSCILSQYDAFGKKTTIKTVYLDDYCSRGERREE